MWVCSLSSLSESVSCESDSPDSLELSSDEASDLTELDRVDLPVRVDRLFVGCVEVLEDFEEDEVDVAPLVYGVLSRCIGVSELIELD